MAGEGDLAFPRPHNPSDPLLMFAAETYARAEREGLAADEAGVLAQVALELDVPLPDVTALIQAARAFNIRAAAEPLGSAEPGAHAKALSVRELKVEGLRAPIGLGVREPVFSAEVRALRTGNVCARYRILVASTAETAMPGQADLWDSGDLAGPALRAYYAGKPLQSRQGCFWRVLAYANGAPEPAQSPVAYFEMGLLDPAQEFTPAWITRRYPTPVREQHDPLPHLRLAFISHGQPVRARLYVSALGLYRIWLNQSEATEDALFRPGWTDYNKRLQIQAYDVTNALVEGQNVLHALLGKGWYAGHAGFMGVRGIYGEHPALAALLIVDYADGRSERVATSEAWTAAFGATQTSDMLMGEIYDARLEIDGVKGTGDWQAVETLPAPKAALTMQVGASQRRAMIIKPKTAQKLGTLVSWYILDFGQNFSGRVRLTIRNARPGTEIVLKHGEALIPEGGVYTANLRRAFSEDRYVCRGGPLEVYESAFTIHGFRYVSVWYVPEPFQADSVTAVVIDQAAELCGQFSCGVPQINALQAAIQWTARSNFLEVQMDCPQRNERLGWLGDANAFAATAIANFDYAAFYRKWMLDNLDARTADGDFTDVAPNIVFPWVGAPGWSDFGAILPAVLLRFYNDTATARLAIDAGIHWLERIETANPDGIRSKATGNNYGDWLSQPREAVLTDAPGSAGKFGTAPRKVVGTAMSVRVAQALAQIAARLNHPRGDWLTHRAEVLREVYARTFVASDGRIEGDTQSVYAQALQFGLVPKDRIAAAQKRLVELVEETGCRPLTGLMGVPHVLAALADAGRDDLAAAMLLQDQWPSWGLMLAHGATTIWERWDGWTPQKGFQESRLNSFNHVALGSIGAYLFDHLAGIRADFGPGGGARLTIAPYPDKRLGRVQAIRRTPHGQVKVRWVYEAANRLSLAIDVAAFGGAHLQLGAPAFKAAKLLDGAGNPSPVQETLPLEAGLTEFDFLLPS